jgi:hypothetical protein
MDEVIASRPKILPPIDPNQGYDFIIREYYFLCTADEFIKKTFKISVDMNYFKYLE